jgi:ribonuclease HI
MPTRDLPFHEPPDRPAKPPEVILYTDGACSGNPGPGGWAYILKHPTSGEERETTGAEPATTNNRMELTAAIRGLEALKRPTRVELITDSEYLAKGLSQWMPKWKRQGWSRSARKHQPPINLDLWRRLDELAQRHQVRCRVVLGHNGHPENERCDQLAVEAYRKLMREGET